MINRDFVLAGKAIFTVDNGQGNWYTFRVTHKPGSERFGPAWFASLLTGPDNTSSYTYVGMIDPELGTVRLTAKSPYPVDSIPVKVLAFALRVLWGRQAIPAGYEIHHEGRCGCCGRALTTPESIESGIGPVCAGRMAQEPVRS